MMNWIQVPLIAIRLLLYLLRSRREARAVACLGLRAMRLVRARRHPCRAETGRHPQWSQTGLGCAAAPT